MSEHLTKICSLLHFVTMYCNTCAKSDWSGGVDLFSITAALMMLAAIQSQIKSAMSFINNLLWCVYIYMDFGVVTVTMLHHSLFCYNSTSLSVLFPT